ncbi:MAG: 50S ribosomal protein L18 [Alphaproteobacteria bacterium]
MANSNKTFDRRKQRVRTQLRKVAGERPRLSVFRSSKHIYAQVIDDLSGETVASASSLEKDMRGNLKTGADKTAAEAVGKLIAERAVAAGVSEVVFDRGGYIFHGRVKALADGAREGGLKF